MFKKLLCPYCFERFWPSQIAFRCINENASMCNYEQDKALQRYLGQTGGPALPRVIPSKSKFFMPREAVCTCGKSTTKAICPRCHNELPHQFGLSNSFLIAMIGAKEVGKSHYVAVLINELKNRIGDRFDAALTAQDERTIQRYENDFKRYIYDNRVTIPATDSARTGSTVRYPLIYRLSLKNKRFPWFPKYVNIDLIFFDTAGEDLSDKTLMSTETKYIANADGLIFLLDPLQIREVYEHLKPDVRLPENQTDQEQIIVRTMWLIRETHKMKSAAPINIPVAVSFSKIDELTGVIDPLVLQASQHNGYLDAADTETVHEVLASHLEKWGGGNIRRTMESNFKTYSFFGLSALGSSPQDGEIKRGVSPFRIEDPLLWILYKKGIIRAHRK